ncbi:hypothetical protein [Yellowstone lake phycodnavirus 3]|jgi:hypothetical protein|uniref:hypothetical protein n=1 Tax=Yellowstone lake phycodnavirus 3 TaxID=1586715 RepID=UPI0006EBD3C4|nr:hypothetical protein AR677_gp216 [Yellowstone lake phycodnavirus 3]BAT22715.1 hypothetical protein [Yellowstone lake phycodnavirus 3]
MVETCIHVRITVRRVQRHPITQRTVRSTTLLKKHVVRGVTLSLIPDALNDFAFHHAQVSMNEVIRILQDQASVSSMSAILAIALLSLRD